MKILRRTSSLLICLSISLLTFAQNKDLEAKSYDSLKELYLNSEDPSRKLDVAKNYHSKAIRDKDTLNQLEGCFLIGTSYSYLNEFKQAIPYFDKALALSKTTQSELAPLLLLWDWKAFAELKSKDWDLALESVKKGFKAYENNKNLKPLSSLVKMYLTEGEVYYFIGNYESSLNSLEQGIVLTNTLNEKPYLKRFTRAKSMVYRTKAFREGQDGEYLAALKSLDNISTGNTTDNESYFEALQTLNSIAIIKTNIEDYKQARKILQEALSKVKVRKFEKNSEEEKLVNHWVLSLNGNLAVTHLRESKPDSALYYLNEVENRNSDLIYPNQEYLLHEFRTQAYLQKQDLQLAENSMKKAAIICDTLFEKPVSPINAFYFGQIYLERKEFYKALNILKGELSNYELHYKNIAEYIHYYKHLATSYQGLKKLDSANIYLEKYIAQKETEDVKRYEIAGEFRKREMESFHIEIETISKEKAEKEGFFRYTIFGSVVVIILMGVVLILGYKKRKDNQKKFDNLFAKVQAAKAPRDIINNRDNSLESQNIPAVNSETTKQILKGLEKLEKEQYFLHPACNAHNVAKRIKTNTTYLSKVINTEYQKNFSSYINELRINYAVVRLKQDPKFRKYTISSIAKELGYKSADSFTKYFKRDTGLLPSFYIEKLNKSIDY